MRAVMEQAGRRLYFMQDNTSLMKDNVPSHKAASNKDDPQNNGIQPILWPAISPDLNLIGAVWCLIKNLIKSKYPEF